MSKVTVSRPQKLKLPLIKGKILLNGNEVEIIKAGKTATFEIPDGKHNLQVVFGSVPPTNSDIIYIDSADSNLSFEVNIKVPLTGGDTTAELTKK